MMTLTSVDLVGVRCCLLVLVLVLSDIFFFILAYGVNRLSWEPWWSAKVRGDISRVLIVAPSS